MPAFGLGSWRAGAGRQTRRRAYGSGIGLARALDIGLRRCLGVHLAAAHESDVSPNYRLELMEVV